jgi:hypothetical protein
MVTVNLGFGVTVYVVDRFVAGGVICIYPPLARSVHGVPAPYYNRVFFYDFELITIEQPD